MPIKVHCDICYKRKECCRYDSIWSCNECDENYPHQEQKDDKVKEKLGELA